jgi:hypothetical protein
MQYLTCKPNYDCCQRAAGAGTGTGTTYEYNSLPSPIHRPTSPISCNIRDNIK